MRRLLEAASLSMQLAIVSILSSSVSRWLHLISELYCAPEAIMQ